MKTAEEIKHWLAVVARARIAVGVAAAAEGPNGEKSPWELERAADYLETAYVDGLAAHGEAVLREHFTAEEHTHAS